ncbi:MAG: hypothetical protein HQ517_06890 [SAR324 cluster bacterium]|nr:hypothetical protein [SAR324 cluster bacterium]
MKVLSTGLGKSVMVSHIKEMKIEKLEDEQYLMMTMASTKPVHWEIKVFMEPADIRRAILVGLSPRVFLRVLRNLIFGK